MISLPLNSAMNAALTGSLGVLGWDAWVVGVCEGTLMMGLVVWLVWEVRLSIRELSGLGVIVEMLSVVIAHAALSMSLC